MDLRHRWDCSHGLGFMASLHLRCSVPPGAQRSPGGRPSLLVAGDFGQLKAAGRRGVSLCGPRCSAQVQGDRQ